MCNKAVQQYTFRLITQNNQLLAKRCVVTYSNHSDHPNDVLWYTFLCLPNKQIIRMQGDTTLYNMFFHLKMTANFDSHAIFGKQSQNTVAQNFLVLQDWPGSHYWKQSAECLWHSCYSWQIILPHATNIYQFIQCTFYVLVQDQCKQQCNV